ILGLLLLAKCHSAHSSSICYTCSASSSILGTTCSNDRLTVCENSCEFSVTGNGSWTAGCSSISITASSATPACSFDATTRKTSCFCHADFCNDFDKIVDNLLDVWGKSFVAIPMFFPSSMTLECFQCGQVNLTGVGLVVVPCDAMHTCHGDYCVTKRGENPHSYCGTAWDGIPSVSCTKIPNEPEICICRESFCNPVLDPVQATEPLAATSITGDTIKTFMDTISATHPKCKNGRFNPNPQAVSMGEKLKNIISNAFNAVNIGWFREGIDDHICNYSYPS
ncbi:hypothetical protein PMAYCL1PPCAC_21044, partial [Pristionchus mayeri]